VRLFVETDGDETKLLFMRILEALTDSSASLKKVGVLTDGGFTASFIVTVCSGIKSRFRDVDVSKYILDDGGRSFVPSINSDDAAQQNSDESDIILIPKTSFKND
jgi:hypothetical protein